MTRVHAFADDALGDLDAVGLVEQLHAGRSRSPRSSTPRSPAPSASTTSSARSPTPTSTGPAREARDPRGGFFAGVPTFLKDNVDVAGMPTQQGTDAWRARAAQQRRRLRPDVPRHRPGPARQDPAVRVRLQRRSRAPAARAGPHPVETRAHRRRLLGGLGGAGRRRRRADRARQRRRRLDPDPGLGQRPGRPQAAPADRLAAGRADAPDAGPDRLRRRASPAASATPPRSSARPSGSTAPSGCRRSATSPARAASGSGSRVDTAGIGRGAVAGGRRAHPEDRAAARGARPPGEQIDAARCRRPFADDFLLYWSMLALAIVRTGTPQLRPRPGTRRRLDNLTLGLARHCPPQPAPAAAARSRGCAGRPGRGALLRRVRRRADPDARAPRRR